MTLGRTANRTATQAARNALLAAPQRSERLPPHVHWRRLVRLALAEALSMSRRRSAKPRGCLPITMVSLRVRDNLRKGVWKPLLEKERRSILRSTIR
jgi:hypothetical protein